jgi:DNA polymerase-1
LEPAVRIFAWDTETWRIVPGRTAPPLVCLSYCWDGGDKGVVSASEGLAMLRQALTDADVILVGHNVAFDVCVACAADASLLPLFFDAYAQGRVRCTQVRELLISIADGTLETNGRPKRFSMEALCFDRFGEDLSAEKKADSWRLNYHRLAGVPLEAWPKEALDYPVRDAHRTLRMFAAQTADTSLAVNADGTLVNEGEQTAAAFCLALAGVWGMRTEPEAVAALTASFTARSHELAAILREEGILRESGVKDTKRVKALVEEAYASMGQEVKRTPTGGVSTERAVLAKTSHRGLLALAESTGVEKMLGTYVPVLEQGTRTPINPGWNVLVATGRTSCREPNLQNLPRKGGIRECFVPRAGWLYAAADYSTLELCALAQVCLDLFGWSHMADALRAGHDLHVRMAANILGISYEEAITRYLAGDEEVAEKRQLAKAANFGYPGGLGAEKFQAYARDSYGVHIDLDTSQDLKRTWLETWPETRPFFEHVNQQIGYRGSFTLEQVRSGRLRGDVGYCDGCNSYFQGLAADGAKAAMWRITQECYLGFGDAWPRDGRAPSPLFGARVVAFIHDEFLIEVRNDANAGAAGDRLAAVMVEGMARYIPDVPVKAEPVLMGRWLKGAKTTRDANGTLIPWTPKEKKP